MATSYEIHCIGRVYSIATTDLYLCIAYSIPVSSFTNQQKLPKRSVCQSKPMGLGSNLTPFGAVEDPHKILSRSWSVVFGLKVRGSNFPRFPVLATVPSNPYF